MQRRLATTQLTSGKDPDMTTVIARGASGKTYNYEIHPMGMAWNDIPANYMFASLGVGSWTVYYIGQCDSAKNRLPCHERIDEAKRRGATHILIHVASPVSQVRETEERDLILSHNPPMNTQHRP